MPLEGSVWNFPMLDYEERFRSGDILIAGTDEAGRGPCAGPLYAAACVFPIGYRNEEINDSKKLTAKKREELFDIIRRDALDYAVADVSAEDVDRLNPYQASRRAMETALGKLRVKIGLVVTDAMPLPGFRIPYVDLVKGDAKCLCIAAASILAKVSRDRYMVELDRRYPEYGFAKHKGYATKEHMEALRKYGPIEGVHRLSYKNVASLKQISLF